MQIAIVLFLFTNIFNIFHAPTEDDYLEEKIHEWQIRLDHARLLASQRKYETAIKEYEKILQEHPNDPEIIGELVFLYANQGNKEKIDNFLSAALLESSFFDDKKKGDLYAALKEFEQAATYYERFLIDHPDDLETRANYAGVLSAAMHSEDSLKQYRLLLEKRPNDRPLRRAYAQLLLQLGETDQAEKELRESLTPLADEKPEKSLLSVSEIDSEVEARISLARLLLYREGFLHETKEQLDALLKLNPHSITVQLLFSRFLYYIQDYAAANALLEKLIAERDGDFLHTIDLAGTAAELGFAQTSRSLFVEAGGLNRNTDELEFYRTQYAIARQAWGDFIASESVLQPRGSWKEANLNEQIRLASLYMRSEKWNAAEQLYREIFSKWGSQEALFGLVELKLIQKNFVQAERFLLEEGCRFSSSPRYQSLLGEIYLKNGRYQEAAEIFQQLYQVAVLSEKQAFFLTKSGLAFFKAHDLCKARRDFERAATLHPLYAPPKFYLSLLDGELESLWRSLLCEKKPPQELNEFSVLFAEEGMIQAALEICMKGEKYSPKFFLSSWMQGTLLATQFNYAKTEEVYQKLYEEFPESSMTYLQLARTSSWRKNYDEALNHYDNLIAWDDSNSLFYKEKARVSLWAKEPKLAAYTYAELLRPDFKLYCPPCLNNYGRWLTYRNTILEVQARFAAWNNLPFLAIESYEDWLEAEPGSESIRFELAQQYALRGAFDSSKRLYQEILFLSPNYAIAELALERIDYLESPKIRNAYDFWAERGYGVLSNITRHNISAYYEQPLDAQTIAGAHYTVFSYHPYRFGGGVYESNGIGLDYRQTVNERMKIAGSLTEKLESSYHAKHRLMANAEVSYSFSDRGEIGLAFERKDEYYNRFGILQDVFSNAYTARLGYNPARKWKWEGAYRYLQYTDHNFQNYGRIAAIYQATEHPCIWRGGLEAEYRNTRQTNIYIYDDAKLLDIIHPYWAPQHYVAGKATVEYFRDLTSIEFAESEKHYYVLRGMVGNDTENNWATSYAAEWHCDFKNRWKVQLSTLYYYSRLWKAVGLWSEISYAF